MSCSRFTKVVVVTECPSGQRNWRDWINASERFRCVGTFETAQQALSEIPRLGADVLLIDSHLGDESGIGCAAKLKERCPSLDVIVLSDSQEHDTVLRAFKAGACGFLMKNSSSDEILWALSEVQAGGAPMAREVARRVVESLRRGASGRTILSRLSKRERDVLAQLSTGKSTKQIASDLGISYQTACVHLRRIYEKLGVRCRTEAVIKYLQSQGDLISSGPNEEEEFSSAAKALDSVNV